MVQCDSLAHLGITVQDIKSNKTFAPKICMVKMCEKEAKFKSFDHRV